MSFPRSLPAPERLVQTAAVGPSFNRVVSLQHDLLPTTGLHLVSTFADRSITLAIVTTNLFDSNLSDQPNVITRQAAGAAWRSERPGWSRRRRGRNHRRKQRVAHGSVRDRIERPARR